MISSCRHNPWLPHGKPSSQNAFLRQDFVAQCVDRLCPAHAAPQDPQSAAPSLLIQGPWGGGKTMMAGAIAEQLAKRPDKLPVLLPQDLPHVLNLARFFMEALHLLLPPDDPDLRRVMEEAYPGAQRGKALDLLKKIARSQGKTLVLIADDLDVLLIQQAPNQEAKLLKQILTYEPWLSMVGTMDDANASHFPAELKGFFTVLRLEPLSDQETIALWRGAVDREPFPVEAALCKYLCRGNPRLTAFLADSYARDPGENPFSSFLSVLDRHTPYYKGLLQELPAVERKVFAALADEWAPAAARAIARKADMDVNKASSLLNRLVKRGRVRVAGKQGRIKSYELEGPANNLNYLVRTGPGHFQQVMGLCLFLEAFCLEELKALPPASKKDSAGETVPPTAKETAEAAPVTHRPSFSSLAEAPLPPPKPERQPPPSPFTFPHKPNPPSPGPDDAAGWTELAKFLEAEGLFEDAVQAYTKTLSIRPDHPWAWGRLGQLLRTEMHLYEDAENAYLQAIEKDANQAWIWAGLGRLLHENLKNYVEAEQAYRIAIELEPRSAEFRVCMGRLHEKLERGQSALRAYEEAANIEPDNPLAFLALAEFLEKQGKAPEAGQAYQSAAECRPNDAKGWALIGRILMDKLGDAHNAKSAFEKALSMEPACFDAWEGLMLLEGASESPEQALRLARAFVEDFGNNPLQAEKLLDLFSNQELNPLLPQVKMMLGMEEREEPPASTPGEKLRDERPHTVPPLADPPVHPEPAEEPAAPPPPSSDTEPQPQSSSMEALKDALLALEGENPPHIRKLAEIIQTAMALTAQGMGEAVAALLHASPLLYCLLPLWAGIMLHMKKEANVGAEARMIAGEAAQRIRSAEKTVHPDRP
ncbi:tetratricopeptide repeat protein [Desulfatibacillum aliphaticivorans]|nr:tetratricopeptide repeat protein [Desulfatibacillum aliphaticivorans]